MPLIFVLLAASAGTRVRARNERGDFPEYISSLTYRRPLTVPVEYEIEHYETDNGNTTSQSVTVRLSREPEAWAPATPFHGWSLETVEAATDGPVRVTEPFAGFDRKNASDTVVSWS
jgi:hypothetical protein